MIFELKFGAERKRRIENINFWLMRVESSLGSRLLDSRRFVVVALLERVGRNEVENYDFELFIVSQLFLWILTIGIPSSCKRHFCWFTKF